MLKVYEDEHGVFVLTLGYVFRPQRSKFSYSSCVEVETKVKGGDTVKTRRMLQMPHMTVAGEMWSRHGYAPETLRALGKPEQEGYAWNPEQGGGMTMTDPKIAPCPFCGSVTDGFVDAVFSRSRKNPAPPIYKVVCCMCGAAGPSGDPAEGDSFRTKEDAILGWNKRGEAHRKAVAAVEKISASVVDFFLHNSGVTQEETDGYWAQSAKTKRFFVLNQNSKEGGGKYEDVITTPSPAEMPTLFNEIPKPNCGLIFAGHTYSELYFVPICLRYTDEQSRVEVWADERPVAPSPEGSLASPTGVPQNASSGFPEALNDLINSYSVENPSGTPDFILAKYLLASLKAFEEGIKDRDSWYGVSLHTIQAEK